ncbi:MAG TPA: ABC transporter substrate-binding protein, partial [Candidatus Binatia bacterium]|nr:ABC transporter substrate-binding protein [Candidatus Binatia bacterium]
ELVQLPVDLIVTGGPGGGAARQVTKTLPIVVQSMGYGQQMVESLARPGGNLTGLFFPGGELEAKRLELLKEAVPGVTRVAVLLEAASPIKPVVLRALVPRAQELGLALHLVEVHGPDDFERAFRVIAHGDAEALVVAGQPLLDRHAERIRDFAVAQRLPTTGFRREHLIAYRILEGDASWRRTAVFIDKILKGARPGDLPMERAVEFELTIDLQMAQELGLTLPEPLLLRADKVFPASGGVPLPASLRIVPPDRRVAPSLAAFSGKWWGTLAGDTQAEHILIVETIDPPHARVIYAWGNGTTGASTAHPLRFLSNWLRLRGQFVEGALQMSFPWGATGIYHVQPDGTLAVTQTWHSETSRATMRRAPE